MTELLSKAFEVVARLPQEQQDAIAREILERVAVDARWDALFAAPRSEAFLKRLADEARADIARGDILDHDPANPPR